MLRDGAAPQVKAYKALLNTFCSGARVEAALMVHLQARDLWTSFRLEFPHSSHALHTAAPAC